ncbi:ScbA/BarX family gamma-butyrolactone biosynthesis protein [Streptacidiphilus fuscans]|nr:ScbA/BarX family gamma-butyrolactone biosynthesis protein [Streptacidiphilus fuscans]
MSSTDIGSTAASGSGTATIELDANDFFQQPVPRRYVHRAAVSEVLLTHLMADEVPDAFRVSAQWPRGHSYYRSRDGRHDPMLLAETIRQAGLMIGHVGYGIPIGHSFIMDRIAFDIADEGLRCGGVPTDLELSVSCYNFRRRGKQVIGAEGAVGVYRGATQVGTGSFGFVASSPAVYKRMRGDILDRFTASFTASDPSEAAVVPPQAVAPRLVARDDVADVVLAEVSDAPEASEPGRWQLRCNLAHPVLFDHPVDHIPGMVLLEAARQTVHRVLHPRQIVITGITSTFDRYAELDVPTEIVTSREPDLGDGGVRIRVDLLQRGESVASALVTAAVVG